MQDHSTVHAAGLTTNLTLLRSATNSGPTDSAQTFGLLLFGKEIQFSGNVKLKWAWLWEESLAHCL